MMEPLFWLLLPVAALSGGWIARRTQRRGGRVPGLDGRQSPPPGYFQGLNHLLNERPDKAIDVFIRMVDVDGDTAETHLALGNLFRRRGEVDRAIRIHQNLIARPSLDRQQRLEALLALGLDYLRAGLLDRAESLFKEVVEQEASVDGALVHLLDIYEQEKEWEQAIAVAERLAALGRQDMGRVIAQLRCEQAVKAGTDGQRQLASQLLKQALRADAGCVRASLLQGQWAAEAGHHRQAIKAYHRVRYQDIEFLPETLEPLAECYQALGRSNEFRTYLDSLAHDTDSASLVIMQAEQIRQEQGDRAAMDHLEQQLKRRASIREMSVLLRLALNAAEPGEPRQLLTMFSALFTGLLKEKPVYRCTHCGFGGRHLHWSCPGCRSWGTVKPIYGVDGE